TRHLILELLNQRGTVTRLGGTDRVESLRTGTGRLRRDIEVFMAPVRRHLAAVGIRVFFGTDRRPEHFLRGHPEAEHKSSVAIIRKEPVVCWLESKRSTGQQRLMPRA